MTKKFYQCTFLPSKGLDQVRLSFVKRIDDEESREGLHPSLTMEEHNADMEAFIYDNLN